MAYSPTKKKRQRTILMVFLIILLIVQIVFFSKIPRNVNRTVEYGVAYYHNGFVYCNIVNHTDKTIYISAGNISIAPGDSISYFKSDEITSFTINDKEVVRVTVIKEGR